MKVCMIGYATYFRDARIKSYVRILKKNDINTDIIALKENRKDDSKDFMSGDIHYVLDKYQGGNGLLYIWQYFLFFIVTFLKVTILHAKHKYSIIHVHNMPNFIVFAAIIPKLFGAKLILDVHDLMTVNYMAKFGVNENHFLIKLLKAEQIISSLFVDQIICADHIQKKKLVEYGIPEKKITVIMNIACEEIFNGRKKSLKKNHADKFKIAYHGTIAERLGIDILLKTMAEIKSKKYPIYLYVYGDGDFLPQCLQLRKDLELTEYVHFSECFFPVEHLPELLSDIDLGIVPNKKSVATDKFMMPVKLMEYVALQIPVVAPRLEIIQHYFDETMVNYFDAGDYKDLARRIIDLYQNQEKRNMLVKNANTFNLKYNWREKERVYINIIHTLQARSH
ncbi:MAG: glycosyltransferase [Proteobacteria bacterium]|nr:glycosyltransferase [Pseudomonadota bacterium]